MLKNNKGVSLLELIAVITILGIIAAVGGVAVSVTLGNARKATCEANMQVIERTYFNENIFHLSLELDEEDLEKSMLAGKCHFDEEQYSYIGGCPDGGVYEVMYVETGAIKVVCSHHGANDEKATNIEDVFDSIFTLDDVTAYLDRQNGGNGYKKGVHLDSNANAAEDSTAYQVTQELKKMGFDTDNMSWRIYQFDTGNYHFYLCNEEISELPLGTIVSCTKYDYETREITTVERKITQMTEFGVTYNILTNP